MNWYIGQKIVAIATHSTHRFKKGDEFTINGLRQSFCNCNGQVLIDIGMTPHGGISHCRTCDKKERSTICWFAEKLFAPLDTDISELTEILEAVCV